MLSKDELNDGRVFILKLWSAGGAPSQWVERLSGDAAARWYEIYRTSDWRALLAEAAGTFRNRVTAEEAELARRGSRCVVIDTLAVDADELAGERLWHERASGGSVVVERRSRGAG